MITLNACTYNKETTNTADNQTIKDSIITEEELWIVPDTITIPHDEFGEMVRYGRNLIVNTSFYIGPEGKVGKYLGNKMNCTNCHQDAEETQLYYSALSVKSADWSIGGITGGCK